MTDDKNLIDLYLKETELLPELYLFNFKNLEKPNLHILCLLIEGPITKNGQKCFYQIPINKFSNS